MKICILSTDQAPEDQRLLEAASIKGYDAKVHNISEISIVLATNNPKIYWRDNDITNEFDVVIPRLNVSFTDYGTNVLQQFICSNTHITESPAAVRLGRDKLKCLQYLLARGLPFPTTAIAYSPEVFQKLSRHTGTPALIKLIEGTEGYGIFLANTQKDIDNIVKTFSRLGAAYIIQEFIQESAGADVRAFVIDGKVVASMRRCSQDGDLRSNISLGGHSTAYALSAEEEDMVLAATDAIGINVAGVDFVQSSKGPLLLEVNVSPDFTGAYGIESVTGTDVAGAIIEFAVRQAQPHRADHKLDKLCPAN